MKDLYEETATLVKLLEEQGLNDFAFEIDNAVRSGSTGTEILMALRWQLKKLLDSSRCPELCAARAQRLYEQISSLLDT